MRQQLFEQYKRSCLRFVETGTQYGAGIRAAIDAGFAERMIVSFETDTGKAQAAQSNFPAAHIYNLPSPNQQFMYMAMSTVPAMFWLDAHCMAPGGEVGKDYPLLAEITMLAESTTPHVILCDDVRLFERYGTSVDDIFQRMNTRQKYRIELSTSKAHLPQDVLALIPEAG